MNKWTNETTSKGVIKTDLKYTAAFRIIPWPNFFFFFNAPMNWDKTPISYHFYVLRKQSYEYFNLNFCIEG